MADGTPAAAAATPGTVTDPYRNYNFKLEIQGVTQAHFTECSNIGVRVEAIAYRQGGIQQVVHRLPGRVEYADVTLRYGLTASTELWQWFQTAVTGNVQRRNVSIILLGSDGFTEAMRWNLVNVWPREWRGAPLDALGQEVAIETLTLVFETLERG
jgi:phage tail-like protein